MIDLVTLMIEAGNGGRGRVSFRREKYVPKGGPDGGHGGNGGSVILMGTRHYNTLQHFAGIKKVAAMAGESGRARKQTGADGQDIILEVPLGTVVWLTAENEISAKRRLKYSIEHTLTRSEVVQQTYSVQKWTDPSNKPTDVMIQSESNQPELISWPDSIIPEPLSNKVKLTEILKEGQRVVICQGGFGGKGNIAFKSSINTTPMQAEIGTPGEQKAITLELKLLADIGLVGYPNAGKSTLLSKITRANPKTADYPFTTIEPNLGVLTLPAGKDLVVADIPGLIEGASQGKGLGHDFLRHIENCQILIFILFLEESVVSDANLTDQQKAELVCQQYQQLQKELKEYQVEMLKKPFLVSLNKIDLYSVELVKAIKKQFAKNKIDIYPFSGFTGEGLSKLIKKATYLV